MGNRKDFATRDLLQETPQISTQQLQSSKPQRRPPNPKRRADRWFQESSIAAFCIFFVANTIAAIYSPIQDCDEVFNYWEPTHYLNHGFGLQTWEYSPEYAIRSWLYIVIHAIPGKFGSFLFSKKVYEFYFVRVVLAAICAGCEMRLFSTVSSFVNPRIAEIFLLAMVTSPGMFHSSVAYLPSSFAMYTSMMGVAAFMDWQGGLKTNLGIMWFGIGATVGWPFSAALILPFCPDELIYARLTRKISEGVYRVLDGIIRVLIVVVSTKLFTFLCTCWWLRSQAFQVSIDAFFYHKPVFVPWRIVSYNIFSGASRGPEIFGTEPWHFYVRNLLLNFNLWFLIAFSAGPVLLLQSLTRRQSPMRMPFLRSMMLVTPFYVWLAIFSVQAHKEERFMYPAYPFLCINAAITLHTMLFHLGNSSPNSFVGQIPPSIKLASVALAVFLTVGASLLRTLGTVTAYSAPLEIYKPLQSPLFAELEGSLCLGKEWYRFPSSYFLPRSMRARFVKSAFDGLLPGQFSEASTGFGFFPTWLIPTGMNDQNIEDPGKHVCHSQLCEKWLLTSKARYSSLLFLGGFVFSRI